MPRVTAWQQLHQPSKKINLILCWAVTQLPEIKLIRTDTTLDLSQKAEKVIISLNIQFLILLEI